MSQQTGLIDINAQNNAVTAAFEAAREASLPCQVIELNNSQEVRDLAPTAYGVFSIIVNGQMLSYHSLSKSSLLKRLLKLSTREEHANT